MAIAPIQHQATYVNGDSPERCYICLENDSDVNEEKGGMVLTNCTPDAMYVHRECLFSSIQGGMHCPYLGLF
jgi:hypothetical protein